MFRIGPHAGPNFPWILLDRALLHSDAVVHHTHARRGEVALAGTRAGFVAELARADRRELEALFGRLRRGAPEPSRAVRDALERAIANVVARIDPVPGEAAAG